MRASLFRVHRHEPRLQSTPRMKILHTADIHLGVNTYGRLDPATGLNTRLLDFKRSFDFMVQRALEEDIDLFLFCGDGYRTADPTPTQQRVFAECLQPIADAGIPIVMTVGNHDHPVAFGKASALDIFPFLQGKARVYRRPTTEVIETKRGERLTLIALPWPIRSLLLARDEFRKMAPQDVRAKIEELYVTYLQNAADEADPSLPCVAAGHLHVHGAELGGSERTSLIAHDPMFPVGTLALPKLDYVALGHIHRHQDLNAGSAPPVVYSSSIERTSYKESDEPKGFVLIDIEPKQPGDESEEAARSATNFATRYRFVETPARRFVAVQVDASEAPEPTEAILAAIAGHDVADAIVRVRYHVTEAQLKDIDVPRLRASLKDAHAIAALERTVQPVERRQRTSVTREVSLKDALTAYIGQHDHLTPVADDLMNAALELEAELEAKRREEA
jgi:exonuclease SbcD